MSPAVTSARAGVTEGCCGAGLGTGSRSARQGAGARTALAGRVQPPNGARQGAFSSEGDVEPLQEKGRGEFGVETAVEMVAGLQ